MGDPASDVLNQHHRDQSLAFEGPGKGYGFPVPKPLRNILVGDDAMADGICEMTAEGPPLSRRPCLL